jgi:hypothetical protein
MVHTLTITIPEDAYAALAAAAASASRTPEELAAEAVRERFADAGAQPQPPEESDETPSDEVTSWREQLHAVMRARGHLAEPLPVPTFPDAEPLPPYGTPERAAFEEELAEELSDALERSGLSILDLVERR